MAIKKECPMLEKCRKASGIDCRGRDWENCDFYKNLLREKEHIKVGGVVKWKSMNLF